MKIRGLDQYLTASPYDDEPDFIEEAEKILKHIGDEPQDGFEADVAWVIEGLLQIIEDEGL